MRLRLLWAFCAAIPITLFAFSSGPPVKVTGAAVDGGANCTSCHSSFAVNSDSTGSLLIAVSNYVPGQKQTIHVTVSHPQAARWGFQLTARLASDPSKAAGTMTPNSTVQVLCGDFQNAPCNGAIEFAEHISAPRTARGAGFTFDIEWTPPANAAGDVIFFAAGNAANGDGTPNGDHIYTTSKTISAVAAGNPTIAGVQSAGDFGAGQTFSSGPWLEIKGTALAATTRQWAGDDFVGNAAPKALDQIQVTVNGRAAYVAYISPTQINVQAPEDDATGPVPIVVQTPLGRSTAFQMNKAALAPGLLAPLAFRVQGTAYPAATLNDGAFVCPDHAIEGVNCRPAQTGEIATLYGIGFGPSATAAGQVAQGLNPATDLITVQIGSANAAIQYAGLAPFTVGLYQINFVVPDLPAADYDLKVNVGSVAVPQDLKLSVARAVQTPAAH